MFQSISECSDELVDVDYSYTYSQAVSDLLLYSQHYGLDLTEKQALEVVSDLSLMLEKNKGVNLTSIRDPKDALVLHCLDSLLFLLPLKKYLNSDCSHSILDMGTGGGFPGIPLSICSDNFFSLVDSVGKKVNSCNEFIDILGLSNSTSATHGRLEDLARESRFKSKFSCVVARALASLDVLIEYGTPFLSNNGYLILSKGFPSDEEISNANVTSKVCGLTLVSRETFELPQSYGHREFYIYKKAKPSSVKLPRKVGEAKKNPLCLQY